MFASEEVKLAYTSTGLDWTACFVKGWLSLCLSRCYVLWGVFMDDVQYRVQSTDKGTKYRVRTQGFMIDELN